MYSRELWSPKQQQWWHQRCGDRHHVIATATAVSTLPLAVTLCPRQHSAMMTAAAALRQGSRTVTCGLVCRGRPSIRQQRQRRGGRVPQ
eukprot:350033-Chlamydomonas_euryale.AAC.5